MFQILHQVRRAVMVGVLMIAASPLTGAATKPTTAPSAEDVRRAEKKAKAIATLEAYYADLYSKPLTIEKDARLATMVAIVSLARIDGAPLTGHLLEVVKIGRDDPWVGRMAWEALHARVASLSPEQIDLWLAGGLLTAQNGGFPGELAAPLISALASRPVDDPKRLAAVIRLLGQIAHENDAAKPYGKTTLDAAAAALATWQDKRLIDPLLRFRGESPEMAKRIDVMLAKLNKPERLTWQSWLSDNPLNPPQTLPAYRGKSSVFAAPEKIVEPFDAKWRQESELANLRLARLDAVICIDATGSMATSNDFVTAYLETALKTFRVITPSIRAGVVYYRHESEKRVMVGCCNKAAKSSSDFLYRAMPLTPDISGLVRRMKAQKVEKDKGHDGGGGAYYSGIINAAKMLGPERKDAARVIIATGDTYVTKGSEKAMVELGTAVKDAGYIVTFLVQHKRAADSVKAASLAASGKEAIVYEKDLAALKKPGADPLELFPKAAFGQMARRVITAALPPDYQDRVDPILNTTARALLAESRAEAAKVKAKR